MKIPLTPEQESFLKHGSTIHVKDEKWYYFPFWFKKSDDNNYEIVNFEQVPDYVKRFITDIREDNSLTK